MNNYRLLKSWETPFDGDIVIMNDITFSMRENVYRLFPRAYRVKHFQNPSLSALLEDCKGRVRWVCLAPGFNKHVLQAYRKAV